MKKAIFITFLLFSQFACYLEFGFSQSPTPTMTAPASATHAPTPSMTATYEPKQCLIVRAFEGAGALNLRKGPGTSYAVILTFHDGQKLVMEGQKNGWFLVMAVMDGKEVRGWVNADYVETCP